MMLVVQLVLTIVHVLLRAEEEIWSWHFLDQENMNHLREYGIDEPQGRHSRFLDAQVRPAPVIARRRRAGSRAFRMLRRNRTFHAHEVINLLYTGIDAVLDDVATLRNYRAGSRA
jgi:hypothetical protein